MANIECGGGAGTRVTAPINGQRDPYRLASVRRLGASTLVLAGCHANLWWAVGV